MKRYTQHMWRAVAVPACLVVAGLVSSCGKEDKAAPEPPTVKTFPVQSQRVTDTNEWFGYLSGMQDTDIHPHVSGFLLTQEYEDGAYVEKGTPLFRIDPAMYDAELELAKANLLSARASLQSAQAALEVAERDVKRFESVKDRSAVAEKDVDDAKHRKLAAVAAVDAAEATVKQCEAAVQKAQINVDYTIIRAPYDGIVGTALVSKGDLVSPSTKMANITSVDPIRLEFSINSDRLIGAFRKYGDLGDRDRAELPPPPPVELVLENGTVYPLKGKLLAMESKVSESGLIAVEGEVDNPDMLLRAGMAVRVRIPVAQKDALLVPPSAIRSVLRSDFIIVVDREQVPHMVPVVVEGRYKVPVAEKDGFSSVQEMLAVSGYKEPLPQTLKGFGYDSPTDATVVADEENAVLAMNISSANSRRKPDAEEPKGKISPAEFSFRPAPLPAVAAAAAEGEGKPAAAQTPAAAKPSLPPFPVKVANLLRRDVAPQDEWFGTLRGVEETDIRPQVTGFLEAQHFNDGDLVKEGDILFTIEKAPFEAAKNEAQANLKMAEASVAQAEAELGRCKADHERYASLFTKSPGAIPEKTLSDAAGAVKSAEAAVAKAQAVVAQMRAVLTQAEINLAYTEVRAPFSGRVGIHKRSVGALVSAADPEPLVTLSSVNPMRVDFQVSGKGALQGIAEFAHMPQQDMPAFDILLEDGSSYPAKGHVVSTDNALSTSTGTLRVVGHVQNVDGGLRSGMPVRVRSGLNPIKGAYLVPARAPLNAQGRDVIVLLHPDNTPELLPVTLGDVVNIPVANAEGQEPVLQPMQIVDVDRALVQSMILAFTKAPSTEALVLQGAEVEDWKAFILKAAGVADFRALVQARFPKLELNEAQLQKLQAATWEEWALKRFGASSYRELALALSGARDELDLIARAQGSASVLEMALKHMGFEDMQHVPVVVEGAMAAAQVYARNKEDGAKVNKLTPVPFRYAAPRTVVESITAEEGQAPAAPEQK